jgi:formamidopyrimidine-DNA glycosylase
MPELPEVEIAARNLRRWLFGKQITGAEFAASRVVRGARPAAIARLTTGRTVEEIARKGKWLRLALDGGSSGRARAAPSAGSARVSTPARRRCATSTRGCSAA